MHFVGLFLSSLVILCFVDRAYLYNLVNKPNFVHSHPHRITSTKCRINTVVAPDDGLIVTRNMQRLININILRINCASSWCYLQSN